MLFIQFPPCYPVSFRIGSKKRNKKRAPSISSRYARADHRSLRTMLTVVLPSSRHKRVSKRLTENQTAEKCPRNKRNTQETKIIESASVHQIYVGKNAFNLDFQSYNLTLIVTIQREILTKIYLSW